ncbi:carbohydrate ABC transporter permease [Phaeobacter sp. PT47_59]|uniref:carbohydrate ABC transporter permease n=1 Tax=Phaeobacter sp. PT47_59 TaxID=3029979 RepID=UPI00238046C8|nr:carbohydrate ABC transporter permease [Phaeobacter sp. PT47_59]MDE4175420.1 carbohydrate ABC transporter permease [Phaeobacter sp. PT47_59]
MKPPFYTLAAKYAVLLFASAVVLYPLVWMTAMSFKPYSEWTTVAGVRWFPTQPTWDNYVFLLQGHVDSLAVTIEKTLAKPLFSSLVTSVCGTLIAVIAGTLSSYAVARFGVAQKLPLSLLQLRLFPPLAVIIPLMVMWSFIGAVDTWWGISLIYGIVTLPFAFWLMKTFFEEVPVEIEDAARVAGCSYWRIFYRITLPIARPGLATCTLFVFIMNWSDYQLALILTQKDWVTLPVYMSSLNTALDNQMYGMKAALGVIAAIPPIVLGLLIQKHLVRGLTFGALKQ